MTGNCDSNINTMIKEYGLSNYIIFLGFLDDKELACYYRHASCLIIPSFYEGFGLPAVESIACGTPVVYSKNTAIEEIVGKEKCGIGINPYDYKEIALGIEKAINLKNKKIMKNEAIKIREKYSWDKVANHIINILNNN